MSLAIDVDSVRAVLFADGWYEELEPGTLVFDKYEFTKGGQPKLSRGPDGAIPDTGFRFKTKAGDFISGPITALLAVRHV